MKIDVNEIEMEVKEERPAELPDGLHELYITDCRVEDSFHKVDGEKTDQKNGERIFIAGTVNHNGNEYIYRDWIPYSHPSPFYLKKGLVRLSELVFSCRGYEQEFDTDDVPKLALDCKILVKKFTTFSQNGKSYDDKTYYTFKGKHRSGIEVNKYKDTSDKSKQVEPEDLPF